jgi:hypothetical protein
VLGAPLLSFSRPGGHHARACRHAARARRHAARARRHAARARRHAAAWVCGLAALAAAALAAAAPPALGSSGQRSIVEDNQSLLRDPAGTLARLRLLGVQLVRLSLFWSSVAPDAGSRRPPRRFDAADPAAYPARAWTVWDTIIDDATADGIAIDLDPQGPAPRWALGGGEPRGATNRNWEPSAADYGQFVHALGIRYSGRYIPPGDSSPLPRVSFWSVWNEPDYGPSLAPQGVPGHLTVENSPRMYRNLVDAAWSALHQTGHGSDTFLFGELAPRGKPFWGVFSGMKPLVFLRAMYCLDGRYRPLRGTAAAIRGCPTTVAGSRRFPAQHPALFHATGISDHPYMRWYPPNREAQPDPDYSTLGEIGSFERALDRIQAAYGSHARLPIWDTEFGYLTDPPKRHDQYPWVSTETAAYYLDWAEYLSWRDARIQSFDQYLLYDPEPPLPSNDWGGFASGLLTYAGAQKPTYSAFRLPLYLPVTTARRGQPLEVWGCVRPAPYAILDTGLPQTAQIQFQPAAGGAFVTVATVTFSEAAAGCYFDVHVSFPASGMVRLAWSYPALDPALGGFAQSPTVYSRHVQITLR